MTNPKNKKQIFPPRSQGVFLIQYMASAPIMTSIVILYAAVSLGANSDLNDFIILFSFVLLPLLSIGFVMVYIPSLYRTRIIFDSEKQILYKVKKGVETEKIDLTIIKSMVSKILLLQSANKYVLSLKDTEGNLKIIFDEDNQVWPFGMRQWEVFAKKLSELTGFPLKQEILEEDFNGKLSFIKSETRIANRKQGLLILLIPLSLSFLGAVGYKIIDTNQAFFFIGLLVVLINMIITVVYTFLNREKIPDFASNNFTLSLTILTMLIPYTIFYVIFVSLLNGFSLPIRLVN